ASASSFSIFLLRSLSADAFCIFQRLCNILDSAFFTMYGGPIHAIFPAWFTTKVIGIPLDLSSYASIHSRTVVLVSPIATLKFMSSPRVLTRSEEHTSELQSHSDL